VRLNDCSPGDLVVMTWPVGAGNYSLGRFGDYALAGSEVFVVYGGPMGESKKLKLRGDAAFVTVADPQTGRPYPDALRVVADVEVIEVVEPRARREFKPWRWWMGAPSR
jgi:hypothetical protein